MTLSRIGRITRALVVSMAVVLGMSACGGYTIGFMWVLGSQYNQIAGFKIDDYTGNLTTMVNSPYPSAGTNPVSLAVRMGGNYVFVVNKGTLNSKGISNGDGNIAVFAVGEDGVLTFQNTYTTCGQCAGVGDDGRDGQLPVCPGLAGPGLCDDGQRGHYGVPDRHAAQDGYNWYRTS